MAKIIIIGSAHPLRGGLAVYNERLAREFLKNNHEVAIFTFSLQYPNFLFPGKSQYSTEPSPNDLKINAAINSINPWNWFLIGRRIKKLKPDIVVVKFWLPFMAPCFGTILRIIKSNKHTKIITIIDNIIPHEKRLGDKALAKYFVKACDGFIAMSKSVLEDLKQFTDSTNVRLIPHPIYDNFGEKISKSEARQKLQLDENGKYILFFGFIRKYKGLDLLLEAIQDKRIQEQKIKLIIAGEFYEDRKFYYEIIEQNNLKPFIIEHTDFIPDSEVKNYFGAADLIVQPYRSATQSGISQMAYHFEKPMLVTNVGGLPEIVPDGKVGYVVDVNAGKIADAIIDFYEKRKEEFFIQKVREEKKKYSWRSMVEGIEELCS